MPVTASLARFIDEELSRAAALADSTVELAMAELRQRREALPGAGDREQHHALTQALARAKPDFVRRFSDRLCTTVRADMDGGDATPAAAPTLRGLELMDESRVEADIEISGAAQRIAGT